MEQQDVTVHNGEPKEKKQYKNTAWYCANVDGYRDKVRQWNKEARERQKEKDPEAFKAYHRQYIKERYKNDEVFRERQKALALERYYKKKIEQEFGTLNI